jgi:hypothetical protein
MGGFANLISPLKDKIKIERFNIQATFVGSKLAENEK